MSAIDEIVVTPDEIAARREKFRRDHPNSRDPWGDKEWADEIRLNKARDNRLRAVNEARSSLRIDAGRRVVATRASEIKPRAVRWVWQDRIALGTLALLAGPPGKGKSTCAYWLAARITRGELPGCYQGTPKAVLVAAAEDSWEHTIVPRLMAAGADLDRVIRIEVITVEDTHGALVLPRDLEDVQHLAAEHDAAVMILDPLMSRIDAGLDTHRDGEVRRALEPTVNLAERARMAVLGLIHHRKGGGSDPVQAVMGSTAFAAVSRSVHTVISDPDDETGRRRVFGTPKNNLGRDDLPSLTFEIVTHLIESDDPFADPIITSRIEWGEEADDSIEEYMRRAGEDSETRTVTREAADWLRDYLADRGGAAPSKEVKDAGAKEGHSRRAIERARQQLRLVVQRTPTVPPLTTWALRQSSNRATSSGERV